jgi:hypothetical protein
LKERLAREGRKLVELGDDDETADREYIRLFGLEENKRMGKPYGLQYAEYHYYFPPGGTFPWMATAERVEAYIKANAVSIK